MATQSLRAANDPRAMRSRLALATEHQLTRFLSQVFGHTSFRSHQSHVIRRALRPSSRTLAILPTGSGKSLLFQLPAVLLGVLDLGLTLVVSPLVALMRDQVKALPPGVKGAMLGGAQSKAEYFAVLRDLEGTSFGK